MAGGGRGGSGAETGGEHPVRAVIFDFGNVISSFDFSIFHRALLSRTDRSLREIEEVFRAPDMMDAYEGGRISSGEFYRRAVRRLDLSMPVREFADAFAAIFTPIGSTRALIRSLSSRYRIGLLSNTNPWHFDRHIRRVGVYPLFGSVTLSYRVGAMKPSGRIYADAAARLSLPPAACVYIDDVAGYARAARRFGFRAIHYTGAEELRGELERLGVPAG